MNTMSMPSQYSQAQLLLLLLLVPAGAQQPLAGCPEDEKCGDVSIPFPFGIKPGCFLDGFQVICNHSFQPPRAFLPRKSAHHEISDAKYHTIYFIDESTSDPPEPLTARYKANRSSALVELLDISPNRSELRVYGGVTSDCANASWEAHRVHKQGTQLHPKKPFLLSMRRNVLIGIGWTALAQFALSVYDSIPEFACVSSMGMQMTDGSCTGMGCCQASAPPQDERDPDGLHSFSVILAERSPDDDNYAAPCSYGMVVETSWYNFSTEDLYGQDLSNKHPRGVPVVLEFTMRSRNHSCPAEGEQPPQGYACTSGNSSCAMPPSGRGYVCRCWENYYGNPYIKNGCQDINECEDHNLNNCSRGSICKNTLGGYECPCKFGMRGDGKEGTCKEILPLPAKVAVGVAALIVVIVLSVLAHQLLKLKKFYEQNGGPILEGVKNIRIYTSKQLKQMTNNYKVVIGEGHFGKVYMGTLKEKEEVAIKKTIKVEKGSKKDFIDEVIIQSGMRHKNIVRLLGCCLEMDVPMLMYEYVVKGSLYDVLFKSKANVPVDTRLKIAIGSAEGLSYMHLAGENTIRHGDVKSANILLDETFTPKICDFGTSKLLASGKSEKSEWVTGDKAYIDPAYMVHGILTQKSDVYSFGIVLIELITRRVAKYDDNMSYAKNFVQACQDQRARNFLDNDITSEKDIELLEMVSEVALECLKLDPEERLDMRQVENRLYIIGQSEQYGQERNFLGNLSPNMEVPFLKSMENKSPTNQRN